MGAGSGNRPKAQGIRAGSGIRPKARGIRAGSGIRLKARGIRTGSGIRLKARGIRTGSGIRPEGPRHQGCLRDQAGGIRDEGTGVERTQNLQTAAPRFAERVATFTRCSLKNRGISARHWLCPSADMGKIQSFRDLLVWQKSIDLAVRCHRVAKRLPRDEQPDLDISFASLRSRYRRTSPKGSRDIRQRPTCSISGPRTRRTRNCKAS